MANFNNPQNLNLSNSFSTVSATLENPAVAQTPEYGDFGSADPELALLLPKNLNFGITSPGTVNMETQCNGLDYMNNNPDFSKLPFQVCLNKFSDQYQIPEMAFNNLINSLPYTFSALTKKEQHRYLNSLQKIINDVSGKFNIPNKEKKVHFSDNIKENFGNKESDENQKQDCLDNNLLTNILYISIIIILCLLFLVFYFKKA